MFTFRLSRRTDESNVIQSPACNVGTMPLSVRILFCGDDDDDDDDDVDWSLLVKEHDM